LETENTQIQPKKKNWLSILLKISLSVLAIYLIYQKVDFSEVVKQLVDAKLFYIFLAFLSFFVSKLISSVRLNFYYQTQNIIIDHVTNAKIYFNAMFYNLIIPLIGGEAFKVFWISKVFNAKPKSLIWSALLDRGGGLVALITLTIVSIYFIDYDFPFKFYSFILIICAYLGSWLLHKLFFASYAPAQHKVNLYSFIVQLLQVVTVYFIIIGLNIQININEYVFIFLLSSFAYILPFLGARELAFVYGAEMMGLNQEISLTISLLFYMVIALNSLLGIVFFIFPIKTE